MAPYVIDLPVGDGRDLGPDRPFEIGAAGHGELHVEVGQLTCEVAPKLLSRGRQHRTWLGRDLVPANATEVQHGDVTTVGGETELAYRCVHRDPLLHAAQSAPPVRQFRNSD